MSTKQFIFGGSSDDPITDGTVEYGCIMGMGHRFWNTPELRAESVIPTAGKLSDFKVRVKIAPGSGKSWTFTIRKNNQNTTLQVTISNTAVISALDTDEVSVAPGDKVCISAVGTSSPTPAEAVYWTCKFIPAVDNETIFIQGGSYQSNYFPAYIPIVSGVASNYVIEFRAGILFPTSGTLKNFYVEVSVAPGEEKIRTFKIRKNKQDSNIVVTISGENTTGNDTTHTLSVSAGDYVTINYSCSTSIPSSYFKTGIVFVPNNVGEWFVGAVANNSLSISDVEYQHLTCGDSILTTLENEQYNLAQGTVAKAIYVALDKDPGTFPDAFSFTLRKNSVDTNLIVTITADNTGGNYAENIVIDADDLLTTKIMPLNTPSQTLVYAQISYLFYNTSVSVQPSTLSLLSSLIFPITIIIGGGVTVLPPTLSLLFSSFAPVIISLPAGCEDIGLRIKWKDEIIKPAGRTAQAGDKLRTRKGEITYAILLVDTDNLYASRIRIFDGNNIKAIAKILE